MIVVATSRSGPNFQLSTEIGSRFPALSGQLLRQTSEMRKVFHQALAGGAQALTDDAAVPR